MPRFRRVRYRSRAGSTAGGGGCTDDGHTPCVSAVSGTVSQGNTLTVTGINLHKLDQSAWRSYWTATEPDAWDTSGANATADGFQGFSGNIVPAYDATVGLFGGQSLKARVVEGVGPITCPGVADQVSMCYPATFGGGSDSASATGGGSSEDIYFRHYIRYDSAGVRWAQFAKNTFIGSSFPVLSQPENVTDGPIPANWFVQNNAATSINNSVAFPHGGNMQLLRWYCIEQRMKCSTTLGNNIYTLWIDGTQVLNLTSFAQAQVAANWQMCIVNACHNSGQYDITNWTTGLATSNTARIYPACMAEITTSATYGGTKQYCAPVSITDTSCQVYIGEDLATVLGAGPYYLHWRNHQQYQAATGFAL